jgi:hypothetical protein
MQYSVSHEVANFLDYGSRLLERLRTESQELSYMELRILALQLGRISAAVKQLDDSKWRDRNKDAAWHSSV